MYMYHYWVLEILYDYMMILERYTVWQMVKNTRVSEFRDPYLRF